MASATVELVVACMEGFGQSWVLFSHGTIVVVPNVIVESVVKEKAIEVLKENGPVYVGTPHADFSVGICKKKPGWMVSSHHSDIITFVTPDQIQTGAGDFLIGMLGRNNRDLDSKELEIVLVRLGTNV